MTWEGLNPPYGTLVIDPPWPQQGAGALVGPAGFGGAKGASKVMPYSVMTLEELRSLPVQQLAADGSAHLYLWTTNGFLLAAFDLLRAWGFRYSTTIVWAKNPLGGGMGGAWGISTEYVLFAYRGKCAAQGRVTGTWFNWKRPYGADGSPIHSAKPEAFLDLVETVSPGPRVELFARRQRMGWDTWGYGYESGVA